MTFRDPSKTMWIHALQMLEKADRMHRQFFQLEQSKKNGPVWEPPVDIFETEDQLLIWIALPGVSPENIRIIADRGMLTIIGEKPFAAEEKTAIRRMEIPHGRFERRIKLKNFEIQENILVNGCLKLVLKKSHTGES